MTLCIVYNLLMIMEHKFGFPSSYMFVKLEETRTATAYSSGVGSGKEEYCVAGL